MGRSSIIMGNIPWRPSLNRKVRLYSACVLRKRGTVIGIRSEHWQKLEMLRLVIFSRCNDKRLTYSSLVTIAPLQRLGVDIRNISLRMAARLFYHST